MATALFIIICIAFIGIGLPTSLLGSAWPVLYEEIGVSSSDMGLISAIITGGTVISSIIGAGIVKRTGTRVAVIISSCLLALALIGFAVSRSYVFLCLCAVPLGLATGWGDTVLNAFVANHYEARHMNWTHCFWGVGATAGPLIMSFGMTIDTWRSGYQYIGVIQLIIVAMLVCTFPLWKSISLKNEPLTVSEPKGYGGLMKLKGIKTTLAAFFLYCAVETTVGQWGSSYMVFARGIAPELAASWISLYFFGIMAGRLISGFLTMKLDNSRMQRLGYSFFAVGLIISSIPSDGITYISGFFLMGMGLSPVFPGLLHITPSRFGKEHSQPIMGMQMATAFTGATIISPIFGSIASAVGYNAFPVFLLLLLIIVVALTETLDRKIFPEHTEAAG